MERVSTDLQTYGLSCHLEQTDSLKEAKEHVISLQKRYDQLLMVLSQQAWSDEWMKGLAKGWRNVERVKATTYLLPLLLERPAGGAKDTWTSQMLNATKTEDFTQWRDEEQYQHALQTLVNDLRAITLEESIL